MFVFCSVLYYVYFIIILVIVYTESRYIDTNFVDNRISSNEIIFNYSNSNPFNQHNDNSKSSQDQTNKYNNYSRTFTSKSNHNKLKDDLIVNTENGYVRGRSYYLDVGFEEVSISKKRRKHRVNAWLGIPYAEKPIGKLRFKRPVPVKNWDDVLNTTQLPNTCYQLRDEIFPGFWGTELWNPNTEVSEDCLYLNVWTPHPKPKNAAVMVWIYGGSFVSGSSTLKIYDPRVIVAETQVIFVSLNYRVSIFGFLYLDHPNAPGNQGLLDQNMALKWVYNNIQFFGGDNTKITIFGESAGSASVSLHLLSPLSEPLFKSAIMQSGSSVAEWATLKNTIALKRYMDTLEYMGCNGTVEELIECARNIDPKEAIQKSDDFFYTKADQGIMQFPFLPVADGYFLEEEPLTLLNRGKFKKCPILLGVNKDESNWFYIYQFLEYKNLTVLPPVTYEAFKIFISSIFHFYPQFPATASKSVIDAIINKYSYWSNIHNIRKNIEMLDDAPADYHFICPALDLASTYTLNNLSVYFYHFTQRATNHLWPDWFGVLHADEVQFVFGEPLLHSSNFSEEEKVLTRKLLKYWSNFAKYDNPNGRDESAASFDPLNQLSRLQSHRLIGESTNTLTLKQTIEYWPKYEIFKSTDNDTQRAYLILDADKIEVDYNLRADYCSFWNLYIPNLMLNEPQCDQNCDKSKYSNDASSLISFKETNIYSKIRKSIFISFYLILSVILF